MEELSFLGDEYDHELDGDMLTMKRGKYCIKMDISKWGVEQTARMGKYALEEACELEEVQKAVKDIPSIPESSKHLARTWEGLRQLEEYYARI